MQSPFLTTGLDFTSFGGCMKRRVGADVYRQDNTEWVLCGNSKLAYRSLNKCKCTFGRLANIIERT